MDLGLDMNHLVQWRTPRKEEPIFYSTVFLLNLHTRLSVNTTDRDSDMPHKGSRNDHQVVKEISIGRLSVNP